MGITKKPGHNYDTHMEVLRELIRGNLSEERFPLTAAVPSVSFADISPHCGESPRTPFQRLYYGFSHNGITVLPKNNPEVFTLPDIFIPLLKKLKIRLRTEFEKHLHQKVFSQ